MEDFRRDDSQPGDRLRTAARTGMGRARRAACISWMANRARRQRMQRRDRRMSERPRAGAGMVVFAPNAAARASELGRESTARRRARRPAVSSLPRNDSETEIVCGLHIKANPKAKIICEGRAENPPFGAIR